MGERVTYCPLGFEGAEVLKRIGGPFPDDVANSDLVSLSHTCMKTLIVDITACPLNPGLRFVTVHVKEFKTAEGLSILARYLHVIAGTRDRAAVVLCDANT